MMSVQQGGIEPSNVSLPQVRGACSCWIYENSMRQLSGHEGGICHLAWTHLHVGQQQEHIFSASVTAGTAHIPIKCPVVFPRQLHVGHVRLFTLCDPVVLTPNRCEIPRCHGCACDLLMRVRDLCAQATKSSCSITSVHKTVRCVKLTFG